MASIFKSKYTGEQIEELLDKASTVSDVQANNGEPTTADLSTIKIGDVNYKIPEPPTPEDPTDVEANPSGEATDELTKLKVGETIYSIPQGSGEGSGSGSGLYRHSISLYTSFTQDSDVFSFITEDSTPYTKITMPITAFGCNSLGDFFITDEGDPYATTRDNVFVFIHNTEVKAYFINGSTLTPFTSGLDLVDTVTAL